MSVPKLRFKEFQEDWKAEQINTVISNKSQKYDPTNSKEDLPCIELEHLSQLTGEILGSVSSTNQKSIKNRFDEKSVLFGKLRPYLKKYAQPKFKGVCSSEIWVLTSKKLIHTFLFQYIQTGYFNQLANMQTGSKMPRSDWNYFTEEDIYYPVDLEQTKIATFLSAVDEKIAQLSRKHELLQQYKQGMMQQLFSQKLRFKDDKGEDYPEWDNNFLSQICSITTGKLDANAMVNGGKYRFYTCAKNYFHIDKYAFDTEALLISGNGANVGYIHYFNGKFNAYQRTYVLSQWGANIKYIQYFLEKFLQERISFEKKEGNTPYIVISTLNDMEILLPHTDEQSKIANLLTAIDNKIDVIGNQLQQAREWKQGLLQQMFV